MSIALVLTLPLPLPLALLIHFQLAGGLLTECFHLNYIFNLLSCNLCKSICVYKMYVLIYKYIRSNDMWIIYARVSENWEHTSIYTLYAVLIFDIKNNCLLARKITTWSFDLFQINFDYHFLNGQTSFSFQTIYRFNRVTIKLTK